MCSCKHIQAVEALHPLRPVKMRFGLSWIINYTWSSS